MDFPDLPFESPDASIVFHLEDVEVALPDEDRLAAWLQQVAETEAKPIHALTFIFCSDEYLRKVNVDYLDHDYYTDIITFPYDEAGVLNGDMFISTERVADNAKTYGVTFDRELLRVMVHGVLHLAGYGDKTPEEVAIIRAKEDEYVGDFE